MARGSALRGATTGQTLQIRGLSALQRDLGKASKTAKKEVRDGLKEIGEIVSDEAKLMAQARGLNKTGTLIRKIVPTVRQQGVFVEAKARKKSKKYPAGYRYPAVYEYGTRRARPFLEPALERKQAEVERAMEKWLDSFLRKNDL
jgi:hypothetical protein